MTTHAMDAQVSPSCTCATEPHEEGSEVKSGRGGRSVAATTATASEMSRTLRTAMLPCRNGARSGCRCKTRAGGGASQSCYSQTRNSNGSPGVMIAAATATGTAGRNTPVQCTISPAEAAMSAALNYQIGVQIEPVQCRTVHRQTLSVKVVGHTR